VSEIGLKESTEAVRQPVPIPPRVIFWAYWAHTLIPLGFALDSLRAALAGEAAVCEKTVILVGAAWVFIAVGAMGLSHDRFHFLERMAGPLMAFYMVILLIGLLEIGFRLETRLFNHTPLFFKPGSRMVFDFTAWVMPGVSPRVRYTVNALGLRGPLPPPDSNPYRIIAIGGSTTECAALDDSQTWPFLLMQKLNRVEKGRAIWVGNAGVSRMTTVEHLWFLRNRPVLREADLLIFLIGVNDLEAALEFGGASTQGVLEFRARSFLEHAPPGRIPMGGIFRQSWLFPAIRTGIMDLKGRLTSPRSDTRSQITAEAELRTAGPILPAPDLRVGLEEYATRVRNLEQECRLRNVRCAFLTQPAMWRPDLPLEERRLLWLGRIGKMGKVLGYASVADLADAMAAYNQTLLDVCREDHLDCYDLASSIPRDTSAFYDDVHFNVGGARMVADLLAKYLTAILPETVASRHAVAMH